MCLFTMSEESNSSEPSEKRYRQACGSIPRDYDEMSEDSNLDSSHTSLRTSPRKPHHKVYNAGNNWMEESRAREVITQKHALCMYRSEYEGCKKAYPKWVMLGDSSSKLVYFVDSLHNNKEIMKKHKLDLNETQTKNFDWFVECVEIMFSGLIYDNANYNWRDEKDGHERFEECVSVTRKYGIYKQMAIDFFHVYRAFTFGFYDAQARTAMQALCNICVMILDIWGLDPLYSCINVGGSSPHSPGSLRVAHFFSEMVTTGNKKIEDIFELFNVKEVEEIRCHTQVPDFVIMKTNFRRKETTEKYVLFGGCNSSDSNEEMSVKLWFQTLKGLFQSDTSYGCGAKASSFVFMESHKISFSKTGQSDDKARINSSLQKFDFVDMEAENPNRFNTTEFCDAVSLMLKIIQESINV